MRHFTLSLLAVVGLGVADTARAADLDYDYLRGAEYDPVPVAAIDWSGVYVGGHGGFASTGFSQRNAVQSKLADYFRSTVIESEFKVSQLMSLPGSRGSGASFGAFAGYNVQFDNVVLGIEADYTHSDQSAWSRDAISRIMTTSAGITEVVSLSGLSNTKIADYGTIRGRAGYAFGDFLPFVTGGLAVGSATISDSVSVRNYGYDSKAYTANQAQTSGNPVAVSSHGYTSFNQSYPLPYSTPTGYGVQTVPAPATLLTANARTRMVAGFSLGVGLEYAITPNVLLRGEYQYVRFQSFNGHEAQLNTLRGGAAVKF